MKPVVYHPQARRELVESVLYYDARQPGLGNRLLADVAFAEARIGSGLNVGSPWRHGTRKIRLKKFPYSLVYRERDDHLFCYAFIHHRRDPDYWQ